jgi:predicted lipid-binding transport protein (Tim44 family)
MQIDLDICVYAVIAALLLGRLWAVLGTRSDNEVQRPSPFTPPPPPKPQTADTGFVMPRQNVVSRMQPAILPPNSLAGGLAQVKAVYADFDEKAFLQESRDIFSTIVSAYAAGNLTSIAEFLSPDLLGHFQRAVDARVAAGQIAQSRIGRIKEADVLSARSEGTQAFVTVKFVSDQENILRDKTGAILGGEEGKYEEVTDTWTFARDTQMPGAKWVVVETRG